MDQSVNLHVLTFEESNQSVAVSLFRELGIELDALIWYSGILTW